MTPVDLRAEIARLRALEAKTTAGPWKRLSGKLRQQFSATINAIVSAETVEVVGWQGFDNCEIPKRQHADNARFIVESHNALPALLDALGQLLDEHQRALAVVEAVSDPYASLQDREDAIMVALDAWRKGG